MVVRLTRDQVERMVAQAQAEAPNECCGVLLGRGDIVEEVFAGRNVHETPRIRYTMHSEDLLRVIRLQDERGWDLVGIYHSHPETKPEPSATDKSLAMYPDARYVIVSLRNPRHPEVRAWRIGEQTESDGKSVTDEAGRGVKGVTEEDVVVT